MPGVFRPPTRQGAGRTADYWDALLRLAESMIFRRFLPTNALFRNSGAAPAPRRAGGCGRTGIDPNACVFKTRFPNASKTCRGLGSGFVAGAAAIHPQDQRICAPMPCDQPRPAAAVCRARLGRRRPIVRGQAPPTIWKNTPSAERVLHQVPGCHIPSRFFLWLAGASDRRGLAALRCGAKAHSACLPALLGPPR